MPVASVAYLSLNPAAATATYCTWVRHAHRLEGPRRRDDDADRASQLVGQHKVIVAGQPSEEIGVDPQVGPDAQGVARLSEHARRHHHVVEGALRRRRGTGRWRAPRSPDR